MSSPLFLLILARTYAASSSAEDDVTDAIVQIFLDWHPKNLERWWRFYWFLGDDSIPKTGSGRTPLHLAATNGHKAATYALCSIPSINIQDKQGFTALHLATLHSYVDVINILVTRGADVSICDKDGKTAADKTCTMGQETAAIAIHNANSTSKVSLVRSHQRTEIVAKALYEHEIDCGMDLKDVLQPNSRDSHDASILHACVDGHSESLSILIMKGRKWETVDKDRRTPLHYSALCGLGRVAGVVVSRFEVKKSKFDGLKSFVDSQDKNGWTALHFAAAGNFPNVVELLLNVGASTHIENNRGDSCCAIISREGNPALIQCLIRQQSFSTSEIAASLQWSRLHSCARDGDLAGIQQAVQDSEDLKVLDRLGYLPIHVALAAGMEDVARTLAEAMSLSTGEIIDLANFTTNIEMMKTLLDYMPDVWLNTSEALERKRRGLLLRATTHGDESIVRRLYTDKSDANIFDVNTKQSILHLAIQNNHENLAEFYIEQGANVSSRGVLGMEPLHYACKNGQLAVVRRLVMYGADVNQKVDSSNNHMYMLAPLHIAINLLGNYLRDGREASSVLAIIKCLLNHSADIHLEYYERRSTLWLAHLFCTPDLREVIEQCRPGLMQPISKNGSLPLHIAASQGDTESLRSILDGGVPVYWKMVDSPWKTAIRLAVENEHVDAAKLLLEYSVGVIYASTRGSDGRSNLISEAQKTGNKEMEDLLRERLPELYLSEFV
ncbi:hypothetical protein AJ80_02436 [Polytolypa hystricis UAMH7299]|uniref:Uncharacterized protein n=1 Tax=Polytolypa hystricis (strain UAMH7299) TaxID=1447883 RepID=A0A2B7YRJ5_POLH7|nr:hypothetical protein AJ80_02436 [Polytolypa hystricis UAMH7299]